MVTRRLLSPLVLLVVLTLLPPGQSAAQQPEPPSGRRVLGYYVPYDPSSWASLQANPLAIDYVAAQWVTIDACGQIGSRDDQTLKQFARSHGIHVLPSVVTFSGALNHRIITDDEASARAIGEIVSYVVAEGYEGFDLDLEGIFPDDRAAYTAFVARLGAALREQGKILTLAIPAKPRETTTGWAGAYDYAALAEHADLITIMAYEFRGPWSDPGSVAPYDWVEQVAAFATSQIPPNKVLLGLAFYGYDWNVTSGGSRVVSPAQATALAERYQTPLAVDPASQSATLRYRAPAGEPPPPTPRPPPPQHEITVRQPPPCSVAVPGPSPTPTPRPAPPPGAVQEHEVWVEESSAAAARLGLADRYQVGGVATWRLGLEDPQTWAIFQQWRSAPR
jgi:spore germination protein YaaH